MIAQEVVNPTTMWSQPWCPPEENVSNLHNIIYYILVQHKKGKSHGSFIFCKLDLPFIVIDNKRIVSSGEDCYLKVLDIETGTEIFVKDLQDQIL